MDDGSKQHASQRSRIEEEAARLVVRLTGCDDAGERGPTHDWAAQSPAHAVAFARAEAAWEAAERLRACPPPIAPESVAGPAGRIEAIFTRRRVMAAVVTASLVAGLLTIALEKVTAVDRYRTEVGQQRSVMLADGSRVRLNTATTIEVAIHGDQRVVHLLDGEALFDVAPDAHRAFVVHANGSVTQALGTRFNLRIRSQLVELTVTRGAVAVRDGASATRRITAGDGAAIRDGLIVQTTLANGALRQRTEWARGVIDLTGASLGQAVDEFNRYRRNPLVIGDSRLATLRVTGRFHTLSSAFFVAQVEQHFALRAVTAADGSILIVDDYRNSRG